MSEVGWVGIKLFHKTQRDLASSINHIIDQYWNDELDEHSMIDTIKNLYINNESKLLKNGKYTTIVTQQCGKRRLEVVTKVIGMENIE